MLIARWNWPLPNNRRSFSRNVGGNVLNGHPLQQGFISADQTCGQFCPMIITRTPLRISIGGGGTDLPSYYSRFGGFVIAAAVNKHIYVGINETFSGGYFLKYSSLEHAVSIDEIRHALIREVLRLHEVPPPIEIVSMADIPAGTGLGSSGAFTVGLLRAVHALKRKYVDPGVVAEEACKIEIETLQQPVGKQDQYIAAYGGLACFEFHEDGQVAVSPLNISNSTLYDLEEHLLMFFTGYSRNASAVLDDQKVRSELGDAAMLENLHYIKQLGLCIKLALENGDTRRFGELMHEHWLHKKQRSPGTSNEGINRWYDIGRENGALGGKLVGAGGGGFLLFYAKTAMRSGRPWRAKGSARCASPSTTKDRNCWRGSNPNAMRHTGGRIGNAHASADRVLPKNIAARMWTAVCASPTALACRSGHHGSGLFDRPSRRHDPPLLGADALSDSLRALRGRR